MNALFISSAAVAIISTIMVISRRNAVHALLYLVLSFLSIAVMFYSVGAPYAAALEIMVYAGAIVILFVFVVMILDINRSINEEKKNTTLKFWIIPVILTLILVGQIVYASVSGEASTVQKIKPIGPKEVGYKTFTVYLVLVELVGILLLAGIVGAYHLGRSKKRNLHRYEVDQDTFDVIEDKK